jgi:hypothetical protein
MQKNKTLSIGLPNLFIGLKVQDRDGKVLTDRYEEGHSWVRNAWNAFTSSMLGITGYGSDGTFLATGEMNAKNTGRTMYYSNNPFNLTYCGDYAGDGFYNSTIGNSDFGVVVGTNPNEYPFCLNAHDLYARIVSGVGVGQLIYGVMQQPVWDYNAITKKWKNTITRVFNNNSGADITIREVGLIYYSYVFSVQGKYLFAHDILSAGVVVPNGAQLTVTYEIESQEFTIDSGVIEMGAAGSGGYVCGYQMLDNTISHCDQRFLYILSPKTGGESPTELQYQTVNVEIGAFSDIDGIANTDKMIAQGASSPAGQFCSAARSDSLGGYNDWYIPTRYEFNMLSHINSYMPVEGQMSGKYLTSREYNSMFYYNFSVDLNVWETMAKTTIPRLVRLIRKIHVSEFVPA